MTDKKTEFENFEEAQQRQSDSMNEKLQRNNLIKNRFQ